MNNPPDLSKLVTWTLVPPHGIRFVNEFGSNCSVIFEEGREEEVAKSLQEQVSYWLFVAQRMKQAKLMGTIPNFEQGESFDLAPNRQSATVKAAVPPLMPLSVDETGKIVNRKEEK